MKRKGAKKIEVTEQVKRDVRQALALYHVQFAYLFGSAVGGRLHAESDVDVAVYFSKNIPPGRRFKERLALHGALAKALEVPEEAIDLAVLNDADTLLKFVAISEGVVLHERNHGRRVEFELEVMRQRDDERFYRLLSRRIFLQRLAGQSL